MLQLGVSFFNSSKRVLDIQSKKNLKTKKTSFDLPPEDQDVIQMTLSLAAFLWGAHDVFHSQVCSLWYCSLWDMLICNIILERLMTEWNFMESCHGVELSL